MRLTRRHFLEWSALGIIAGGPLSGCTSHRDDTTRNIILGGGRYKNLDTGETEHLLSIIDLDSKSVSSIPLDFLAHGIHFHVDHPYRLAIFEKKGPNAIELDLAERRITRRLALHENRSFYGHGAYSADGRLLFCTETQLDTMAGVIAVRDAESHAYLGEFPSYGQEPHQCRLIDGGKTMVVTNGGGDRSGSAPSVAYIDVASKKLIELVKLTNGNINTGHVAIGRDGALVVVSAPRRGLETTEPGGISIRPPGSEMRTISEPRDITKRMRGEALSVVIQEEKGIAAVTHPDGGMVTFWSVPKRQLLEVKDLPHPRGVTLTLDDQFFVISYGLEASLLRVRVEDLSIVDESIEPNTYTSGSHIYNWSRDLREQRRSGALA